MFCVLMLDRCTTLRVRSKATSGAEGKHDCRICPCTSCEIPCGKWVRLRNSLRVIETPNILISSQSGPLYMNQCRRSTRQVCIERILENLCTHLPPTLEHHH